MLSRADANLANRDRALQRGLALLLDEEAFTDALRYRLSDIPLRNARSLYVRYKAGTNCLVAYRLNCEGLELDIYAKAFRTNDRVKFKLTEDPRNLEDLVGPVCLKLEGETVFVSFFPNDSKLKALKLIGANGAGSKLVRKLVPGRRDLWDAPVHALRYKPERRFVARVGSTGVERSVVLKLYAGVGLQAAWANARAFNSRGVLRLARPLGAYASYGALVLEWLDGTPLNELLTTAKGCDVVTHAGEALAELHAQEPDALRRRLPGLEIRSLLGMARGLDQIVPTEGARAESLAREIANSWSRFETFERPIHGDFYSSQVLSADGHISILDLDEAAWGNPTSDLGNFLAHLERESVSSDVSPGCLEEIKAALLEGYSRAADRSVDNSMLAVFTAASLIKLAHHPFRLRERDWPRQTSALIDRAEQLLTRRFLSQVRVSKSKTIPLHRNSKTQNRNRHAGSAVVVSDPTGAANDPALPFLRYALDPVEATVRLQERLEALDHFRGLIELQGIRVTRHKPGRRCLVEYDLALIRPGGVEECLTLLGKARTRGLDDRCFRLLMALRQKDFNENNRDGIAVPEAVAVVPEFHMWLQRKVPGVLASDVLTLSRDPQIARHIADAIHKIQKAGIEPWRRHTVEDELSLLSHCLATVTATRPLWRSRLERVMEACQRLGGHLPPSQLRPAHRDFHPNQVLVHNDRLYLLDFDLYAAADPGLDAGNFIAHLIEQNLRHVGNPEPLASHQRTIWERFAPVSDNDTRIALDGYTTLTLVRHIYISSCIPERREFTEEILEICERRLDISRRLRPCHLPFNVGTEGINHADPNL